MTSYLRNLFGGQSQPSKSHSESRSRPRSRPAPAVAYPHKSSRSASSDPTPARSGVKRTYSATRSYVPSPLRDVANEQPQRPVMQRSSSSRSYSKNRSPSSSPSNSQYSGPGTGTFTPHFPRSSVNIISQVHITRFFPQMNRICIPRPVPGLAPLLPFTPGLPLWPTCSHSPVLRHTPTHLTRCRHALL